MSSLLLGASAVYLPQQSPRSFQPPQYSPHPQTAYVMQPQPLQPQPQLVVQQGGGFANVHPLIDSQFSTRMCLLGGGSPTFHRPPAAPPAHASSLQKLPLYWLDQSATAASSS